MLTIFSKIAQWGVWSLLGKAFNTPAFRQFALVAGCAAGIYGTLDQCSKKRTAQEALRVAQGQVASQAQTISQAMSLKKSNYVQQAKVLIQDSVRAASLPADVLEHENDSLLISNRLFIQERAKGQQ